MFDFSWSEFAIIGVVALVVIGPKDLPKALRTAGILVRKARTISREFQSSVEQMVREAELEDVKKDVEKAAAINLEHEISQAVDPGGEIAGGLKAIETPPDIVPPEILPDSEPAKALPTPEAPPAAPPAESAAAKPAAPTEPASEPHPTRSA